MTQPLWIKSGDLRGTENTEETKTAWNGPSAEIMLALAAQQPGARMRQFGIKFRCDGCHLEGHDRSMDNACVFLDGRFSCAHSGQAHRRAIATQLNIPKIAPPSRPTRPVRKNLTVKQRPTLPMNGERLDIKPRQPLPTRRVT